MHKKFKITDREQDILNILWAAEKPLVASDIAKSKDSLSINTVQAVLRKLLQKKLIKVADIVYSGTVLSRTYQPTISPNDFTLQQFVSQFEDAKKNITIPDFVATLLEHEKDEAQRIEELEALLEERKRKLKSKEK
ncbi:BlaI/MecI/CopY family transcriptional regulator [Anaerocolumna jejuensis]|uniref:BlaI/MecI/CopY family transcriptional regulator n=1 Tax=Anaerocolumna jejuensis TaxID=259063 RepID=UPI003F7C91AD